VTAKTFGRQLIYLNAKMVIKKGLIYFRGGHKVRFCCTLRDHWKNLRDCFGLSKHLKKAMILHPQVTVNASVEQLQ